MAGRSLRLARSPLAPKITIAHGGAVGIWDSFKEEPTRGQGDRRTRGAEHRRRAPIVPRSPRPWVALALHLAARFDLLRVGALDRVPAELVAEPRGEAGGEVDGVAAG